MHTIELRECNVQTGSLTIGSSRLTRAVRVRPSVISITPCLDSDRADVVRFIKAGYRKHYGARIQVDYPSLISVRNANGGLIAAAGYRLAGVSSLFLEHYTGKPIDGVLGVCRRRIAEVGNLVSRGGGASIFLFTALVSYLDSMGISYAAVTGTESLERRLRRLGAEPHRICTADPERVAHLGHAWGRYYANRPYVLAGRTEPFLDRLREEFGENFFTRRPRLFPRLHFKAEPL